MAIKINKLTQTENIKTTDEMVILDGSHTLRTPSAALTQVLNAGNLKMPDSDETIAEHYRQFCNRTLLDNWYFANPVNQRGQTEYTGSGYTIDRWRSNNSTVVVSIMSGKIKLELSAKTIGWVFFQPIQKVENLVGKSVTVSAKIASFNTDHLKLIISARDSSDVEIATASASVENGIISATMLSVPKETVNFRVGIYAYDGSVSGEYVELEAMKLELGHRQTLAHKENNVWVLNEIPDYATELAKCQRYFYKTQGAFEYRGIAINQWYMNNGTIELPVSMRIKPTCKVFDRHGNAGKISIRNNDESVNGILTPLSNRTLLAYAPDAGFTIGTEYDFAIEADANL